MKKYRELDLLFKNDEFRLIDQDPDAQKFYYLRSISRSKNIKKFCNQRDIQIKGLKVIEILEKVFADESITPKKIEDFINSEFSTELAQRNITEVDLVRQLNRVQDFDWGGSFGNSLEKNIVNNYVKKYASYDEISSRIENELFYSLRRYTINSWYNHWSSILIEDIFKSHSTILPTIGLIKKIDFFINGVPFDLKVTYFPEEFMSNRLREKGFGVELTRVKEICRKVNIPIDNSLPDRALNIQLQSLLDESVEREAISFMKELNSLKKDIIDYAIQNPEELINWLYENQGELRFDASNRFFLILIDTNNIFESWKLKRNLTLLETKITQKLNDITSRGPRKIEFYWAKDGKNYVAKSDILFISK